MATGTMSGVVVAARKNRFWVFLPCCDLGPLGKRQHVQTVRLTFIIVPLQTEAETTSLVSIALDLALPSIL